MRISLRTWTRKSSALSQSNQHAAPAAASGPRRSAAAGAIAADLAVGKMCNRDLNVPMPQPGCQHSINPPDRLFNNRPNRISVIS
jgi:hypothetical protein